MNVYKADLMYLMEQQEQSNGIERITKVGDVFEYIRIHKGYIKPKFPVLYSVAVQKAIQFERDLKQRMKNKDLSQEDLQLLQICLTKINLFQWNI